LNNGELIDEFVLRINSLAEKLRSLGEVVGETRIVKKILCVLSKQYNQIAVSIETLLNINTLMVEELVGRLHAAEDRLDIDTVTEKTEKLYLSEDQWLAKYHHCSFRRDPRLGVEESDKAGSLRPSRRIHPKATKRTSLSN
jgi:hypothetical protein